jgi:hypothetical protein
VFGDTKIITYFCKKNNMEESEFDYVPDFEYNEELTNRIVEIIKSRNDYGQDGGIVIVDEFEFRTKLEKVLFQSVKRKESF